MASPGRCCVFLQFWHPGWKHGKHRLQPPWGDSRQSEVFPERSCVVLTRPSSPQHEVRKVLVRRLPPVGPGVEGTCLAWWVGFFSWLFRGPLLSRKTVFGPFSLLFRGFFRGFFVAFSWPRFGQILRVLALEQSSDLGFPWQILIPWLFWCFLCPFQGCCGFGRERKSLFILRVSLMKPKNKGKEEQGKMS